MGAALCLLPTLLSNRSHLRNLRKVAISVSFRERIPIALRSCGSASLGFRRCEAELDAAEEILARFVQMT